MPQVVDWLIMKLSNSEDAFRIQRKVLEFVGLWPNPNSKFSQLWGITTLFILLSFSLSLFIPALTVKEFSKLIQNWTWFICIVNCFFKFSIFFVKRDVLFELLTFLRGSHFNYYNPNLDYHIQRAIRIAKIMVKIYIASSSSSVLSVLIAPFTNWEGKEFPLPFPLNVKEQNDMVYGLVYAFQTIGLVVASFGSIGIDNVGTCMMMLVTGYFKILKTTIVRITNPKNLLGDEYSMINIADCYGKFDVVIHQRLTAYSKHHLAVIKFAESTESIFTYIVLLQFLASSVGICLAGFTFTTTAVGSQEFLFALSLPVTLMFQISLYCTFGNELTLQSEQIGHACYMSEWLCYGPLVRKTLFIIMQRSKRPVVLTAGKFMNLSLSSLIAVFKSAVSYAAVLRQLTNK